MKLYTKPFKDGSGSHAGFKWWLRWNFAAWCWRRWLRYEGLPKGIKSMEGMEVWEKEVLLKLNKNPHYD